MKRCYHNVVLIKAKTSQTNLLIYPQYYIRYILHNEKKIKINGYFLVQGFEITFWKSALFFSLSTNFFVYWLGFTENIRLGNLTGLFEKAAINFNFLNMSWDDQELYLLLLYRMYPNIVDGSLNIRFCFFNSFCLLERINNKHFWDTF